jgi:hypothetical protein
MNDCAPCGQLLNPLYVAFLVAFRLNNSVHMKISPPTYALPPAVSVLWLG